MLIRATRTRDHSNMVLFLILIIIGVFVSFVQMFSIGLLGLPIAISAAVVNIYIFICVYSLYDETRNEKLRPPPVQPYAYELQPVIYAVQQPDPLTPQPPTTTFIHYDAPNPYSHEHANSHEELFNRRETNSDEELFNRRAAKVSLN